MMKKCYLFLLIACLMLFCLAGCDKNGDTSAGENGSAAEVGGTGGSILSNGVADTAPPETAEFAKDDSEIFTDRDGRTEYDESGSVRITLSGESATASSNGVIINGSTITITEDRTHILLGSLTDGQIIVDAPDTAKLQIVLEDVSITSSTSAALYIREADKVFVTLVGENTLANGGSFVAVDENNIDGAVFSKQDLTLNGEGSLTVTSPAGHGVVCKDDLVITSGTYTVNASAHALDANDSVRVQAGTLTLTAGKDGIHAENTDDATQGFVYISDGTCQITAEGDGISAGAYLQIAGGTFDISAGGGHENGNKTASDNWGGFPSGGFPGGGMPGQRPGRPGQQTSNTTTTATTTTEDTGSSMKGLKATTGILIDGGTFTIDSADDAIHSNTILTVNGGTFTLASGDDALHAEDTLTITAGDMTITNSYEGLEAHHVAVKGGNIRLVATDDGINAAGGTDESGFGGRDDMFGGPPGMGGGSSDGSIVIEGGTVAIQASGDGLDANGTLEISGGYVTVTGPTQGDTSTLDFDVSGIITGGTFIGTGASGMAQTFSGSEQGVIAIRSGSQPAGTTITLTDKNGNAILSHTPTLGFQVVILSSPAMIPGESYTLTVGEQSDVFEATGGN